jgi:hypothetical protein
VGKHFRNEMEDKSGRRSWPKSIGYSQTVKQQMKTREKDPRWSRVYQGELTILPISRIESGTNEQDHNGGGSNRLFATLRGLGVMVAVFHGDVAGFRDHLKEASQVWVKVLKRAVDHGGINWSYLTVNNYQKALTALACGEFEAARLMMTLIRSDKIIELLKSNHYSPHPFEEKMGGMIAAIILDEPEVMDAADEWERYASINDRDFVAYSTFVKAIHGRETAKANAALAPLLVGHRRQAKRGIFKNSVDELLATWAIGLINLARSRSMEVTIEDEMLPNELFLPVAKS